MHAVYTGCWESHSPTAACEVTCGWSYFVRTCSSIYFLSVKMSQKSVQGLLLFWWYCCPSLKSSFLMPGEQRQTGELCSKILWFETEEHQEWSRQQTSESWHWKLNTGLNLVSRFSPSMCWHRLSAVQRACCLCFPLELQSSWSAWLLWLSSSQDTALGMSGAQLPAEPVFSALSADSTLGWRSTAG